MKELNENQIIEQAIEELQKQPTDEMLAHTLTVLRRRMNENAELIVAVEQNIADDSLGMRIIKTNDQRSWFAAFTGFEEQMKGSDPVMSAFTADIRKIFQMTLESGEVEGLIINPWNRTIMLDKNLIRIIVG